MDNLAWIVDVTVRELMLFAGVGFLVGGIDDLLIDAVFLVQLVRRRLGRHPITLASLPQPDRPGRLAIFIPAWREEAVIGAMLGVALGRLRHADYRLYVGCYPNDRATIDAVADIAARDSRVRLVIGEEPGPTTKAGCLNTLWRALLRDDAAAGKATRAVILHDAEDVVHADELAVFDALLDRYALVQLPVLPFVAYGSPFVSGHYADEFAEAHGKQLPVRAALGAGLPLAGVACAIRRDALQAMAAARHGDPFDAQSLTEDYELHRVQDKIAYPESAVISSWCKKPLRAASLSGLNTRHNSLVGRTALVDVRPDGFLALARPHVRRPASRHPGPRPHCEPVSAAA